MGATQSVNRYKNALRRRRVHWVNNQRIRNLAQQVEQHIPEAKHHPPVIVFNASTRLSGLSLNAAYAQLSGWALRLAGAPVVNFACHAGMSRCVLGTNRDDVYAALPCQECIAQSEVNYAEGQSTWFEYQPDPNLAKAIDRLSLEELSAFEYQDYPLGNLVLPTIRWVLRRHHLVEDESTRFLYREFVKSAWSVARQFEDLMESVQPAAVLVFNGMFFPEATARWIAQSRGVRVISHEVGLRPFTGFFTTGEATAYPIQIPDDYQLSAAQNAQLDAYLAERFQGNFTMAGVQFWPEIQSLSPVFLTKAEKFKQIVPVFTNVVFDTSQGHANVVYPHMFAWLDDVYAIIKAHPETLFVIRAHPDESRPGKASRESVANWVRKNRVDAEENVLFVGSDEYFSSYELIQRSKFVMIYNSTIGLEASVMGAPVLCGGKARFTQLDTVFFPKTAEEYRQIAESFLETDQIQVPEIYRTNARRFLYYQLFRTSLSFEDYLEEDGVWQGYVMLKPFPVDALRRENSETFRIILDGILEDKPFLKD